MAASENVFVGVDGRRVDVHHRTVQETNFGSVQRLTHDGLPAHRGELNLGGSATTGEHILCSPTAMIVPISVRWSIEKAERVEHGVQCWQRPAASSQLRVRSIPRREASAAILPSRFFGRWVSQQVGGVVRDNDFAFKVLVEVSAQATHGNLLFSSAWLATAPRQTMYSGLKISSCCSKYSRQFDTSSGSGFRFPGGRHLTVFKYINIFTLHLAGFDHLGQQLARLADKRSAQFDLHPRRGLHQKTPLAASHFLRQRRSSSDTAPVVGNVCTGVTCCCKTSKFASR